MYHWSVMYHMDRLHVPLVRDVPRDRLNVPLVCDVPLDRLHVPLVRDVLHGPIACTTGP